jgi:signal peptidase I
MTDREWKNPEKTEKINQETDLKNQGLSEKAERKAYRRQYWRTLQSTIFTIGIVAAIAFLISMRWIAVFQIYGSSMSPLLNNGEMVVAQRNGAYETGDVIAFYYNNKILVKRVIAEAGDWVDIKDDGTVYVNDVRLDEPYLEETALGDCNIQLPYQVPDSRVFVMGDQRSTSADSRNMAIGCVSEEQIIGRLLIRIWPLTRIGLLAQT